MTPADPARADLDAVLVALADPTRKSVLELLATDGEAGASGLARRLPVTRQAVVKHLTVLEAVGLVTARRAGREVLYTARPDRLATAARWMAELADAWDTRLAAIKRIAES